MHAPEYTARIKALIAAKEEAEENMKRVLFQFRNGRTPNPEDISDAREKWAEALAVVDPDGDRRAKLEESAREIIGDLETEIQRSEAETFYGDHSAVIIVPGEEGLYSGRVITVYPDGTTLTADTGSWGKW